MISLVLAAAFASQSPTTGAKGCLTDTVSRVARDKDDAAPFVIQLASGRQLRIAPQDFIDPKTWRRGDPVIICPTDDSGFVELNNTKREERLLTWTDARPR